jgi:sporulation protein YlmC with PRC-barrel domain
MLCSIRELQGYGIEATDGPIGRVHEMLFHDDRWVIRYLVVDTGKWLPGRKVLVSPISVESIDAVGKRVTLQLDKEQIRKSPDIYADEPVSRQREAAFYAYYGYGPYWAGPGIWGAAVYPRELRPQPRHTAWPTDDSAQTPEGDPHLRSTREVIGYHIAASDGDIGHVHDLVIDDGSWTVRHIVVDTSNWPGGRSVLLLPTTVRSIDWSRRKVHVDATAEQVRTGPEYRAAELPR